MGVLLGEAVSTLGIWESSTLKVGNKRRNVCHFKLVSGGVDGVFDKAEFGLNLVKFSGKAMVMVIIMAISFNFCNCVPIVKVGHGLTQGVVSRGGTSEYFAEPAW